MKRWLKWLAIAVLSLSLSLSLPKIGNSPRYSVQAESALVGLRQIEPVSLVQLAQQKYQASNFQQAIDLLQQAEAIYQNRQNKLQQARILALISLTRQQLGQWQAAEGAIASGFDLLANLEEGQAKQQVLAQLWNSQGHLELAKGQFKPALVSWQEAEKLYRTNKDTLGISGSLINQAEALDNLGFYRRACDTTLQAFALEDRCESITEAQITKLLSTIQQQPASWQITGLINLGNSLFSMGKLSSARIVVESSQTLAQKLKISDPIIRSKLLLSLGNIHKKLAFQAQEKNDLASLQSHSALALKAYHQIERLESPTDKLYLCHLQAKLNQLNLLIGTKKWTAAKSLVKQIKLEPDLLTNNRQKIYALINFSRSLTTLKEKQPSFNYPWQKISLILEQSLQQAQKLNEPKAQAYALGYLGKLAYEQKLKLQQTPQQLLEQAVYLAQSINAPEISYRWQWQLGKIYRSQQQNEQAIVAYQAAFDNLQNLRGDLVALNQEIQFSFQEEVEPIYRELAELLLINPDSKQLKKVLDVIEGLQLAELDNYFQDACVTFSKKRIDAIDPNAAVIHSLILPESLEVILSLPNGSLAHHSNPIPKQKLIEIIQQLRQYLQEPDRMREVQQLSQQLYSYSIEPFETQLNANNPKTLVFVLDDILQNIPMGVLYDGQNYLLQKYAIAVTPGLQLLVPEVEKKMNTLAAGVSESRQVEEREFNALNNVEIELKEIKSTVKSETLLNSKFTETNLLDRLNSESFSILHLATHGQFSSDPERTFLLFWDRLLKIKDFSNLLQNSSRIKSNSSAIDLLVLSACETATGDKRAALGLAGMAVRTGASSTLASLWQISDESTAALMAYFYRILEEHPDYNKAEALRLAQLSLWNNSARDWQIPSFWAAYILVGNWQ